MTMHATFIIVPQSSKHQVALLNFVAVCGALRVVARYSSFRFPQCADIALAVNSRRNTLCIHSVSFSAPCEAEQVINLTGCFCTCCSFCGISTFLMVCYFSVLVLLCWSYRDDDFHGCFPNAHPARLSSPYQHPSDLLRCVL